MNSNTRCFLALMKGAVLGEKAQQPEITAPVEWQAVFRLASLHCVLPMIIDCAYRSDIPKQVISSRREEAVRSVKLQVQQTEGLHTLCSIFRQKKLDMIVVGGIICRYLYPQPDLCISGYETFLIRKKDKQRFHHTLLRQGFRTETAEEKLEQADEITYYRQQDTLLIKLHCSLFSPNSVHADANLDFQDISQHAVCETIGGTDFLIPAHTEHAAYVITHAMEHSLRNGFGIRQAADICLYTMRYGQQVDWEKLVRLCREQNALAFVASVFRLGREYLGFNGQAACCPDELYAEMNAGLLSDEEAYELLLESLEGGSRTGISDVYEDHSGDLNTFDHLSMLRARIENGETVVLRVSGGSMAPFLSPRRDYVTLRAPKKTPHRGDIVFYQRKEGQFVLHRMIRQNRRSGTCDFVGDAQTVIERGVRTDQIIAVATQVRRDGRIIRRGDFWWWFFRGPWLCLLPVRPIISRLYGFIHP